MTTSTKKTTAKTSSTKTVQAPETPADGMIKLDVNGIKVAVNVTDLDDVDVLYKLRDANNGDLFAALDVIDVMIGEEQRRQLVDTIRDPQTGRASAEQLGGLLEDLFRAIPKS